MRKLRSQVRILLGAPWFGKLRMTIMLAFANSVNVQVHFKPCYPKIISNYLFNTMDENTECCVKFDPKRWDEKEHNWENKKFIKDSMPTFFHIPFPPMIAKKLTKMWGMVVDNKANSADNRDSLFLFYDPHPFKSEMYLSVNKEVPGAINDTISGNFISKVYDGPYNAVPKFMKKTVSPIIAFITKPYSPPLFSPIKLFRNTGIFIILLVIAYAETAEKKATTRRRIPLFLSITRYFLFSLIHLSL